MPIFALTLFANAALLFAVQPMFSKMALPLLGGAPAVWNTCMLVFQSLLLGGYLYAHLTTRWLTTIRQVALHAALLILSLLALPVMIPAGWEPPGGSAPIPWLVALLIVGLGLPFFLLSTGAPLLQQWFSRTAHRDAGNPYFLYAASNLGSFVALLAYPLVLEPLLGLQLQSRLWSWVYAANVLLVCTCGWYAVRGARTRAAVIEPVPAPEPRPAPLPEQAAVQAEGVENEFHFSFPAEHQRVPHSVFPVSTLWRQRIWWTLLAFAPSSLLLGVTTYLTTDLAAMPLLWVVPLALYLLTFVLVFARRQLLPHRFMLWVQPLVLLPVVLVLFTGRSGDVLVMGPLHLVVFFATAMVCHGELARLRPGTDRLTEFYLWLSVGGVLGGVFNVLVAPQLFTRIIEYQLILGVACALRPMASGERWDYQAVRRDVLLPLLIFAFIFFVLRMPWNWHPVAAIYGVPVMAGLAALGILAFTKRPLRFGLGVLAILMGGVINDAAGRPAMYRARSFFGVYAVRDAGNEYHTLQHGTTMHGAQNLRHDLRTTPLTYYRTLGPFGDVMSVARLATAGQPLHVGVVGLGTGSAACHARDSDRWTFYEIDPLMVRIARDTSLFTYLADCTPDARIVLGDARISLARVARRSEELDPALDPDVAAPYDLIVLDAFTSDAIPVHLLTREALDVYLSRLSPNGVLTIHISNRYLDLRGVVANIAHDAGVAALVGNEAHLTADDRAKLYSNSTWAVITRSVSAIEALLVKEDRWQRLAPYENVGLWTDDYSNVLGVLVR